MSEKKTSSSFNKQYKQLQTIVAWFEQEDIDLEEGVKKFEEGSKLVKELKNYLETMENKIKELKHESQV